VFHGGDHLTHHRRGVDIEQRGTHLPDRVVTSPCASTRLDWRVVLETHDLHKRFGGKAALSGVSLAVGQGTIFGFVGANGAGKTTTMRIVMGLLEANSGTSTWDGKPLTLPLRRRLGYMPEERGLYPKMRVREQIVYFGRIRGLDRAVAGIRADELIGLLGLTGNADRAVEALSLGNQQRVQLAVALVSDPVALVLDEPFSGLDPIAVDALTAVLKARAAQGAAVIFSSHQLELVERICDTVGIIAAGVIVATGPVQALRAKESRQLKVVVRDARPGWAAGLDGELTTNGDRQELVTHEGDDQAILRAAMRSGRVEHFGFEQPTLAEIFREVVA